MDFFNCKAAKIRISHQCECSEQRLFWSENIFFSLKNDQKLDLKNRIALRSQIFPHLSPFTMCADSLSLPRPPFRKQSHRSSSSTYPISVKGRALESLFTKVISHAPISCREKSQVESIELYTYLTFLCAVVCRPLLASLGLSLKVSQ